MAVAEHGAAKVKQTLRSDFSELQLRALLNYANLANNGEWHDGRMLASGPRINPWLQEASERKLEAGDLMGFDADMIGPMGYFADLSRTFFCGPVNPTARQKQLYRLAMDEITHNLKLIKAGVSFNEIQYQAYLVEQEFQQNAYPCNSVWCWNVRRVSAHQAGILRPLVYDETRQAGMVVCLESYMGATGKNTVSSWSSKWLLPKQVTICLTNLRSKII